jgi:hypothetical protein
MRSAEGNKATDRGHKELRGSHSAATAEPKKNILASRKKKKKSKYFSAKIIFARGCLAEA